ncbi:MAG: hypothetical protein JXA93_00330 [Anaerolineae bacterium]|nr:hypothetical protein [Anaerolineae bacterium]
MTNDLYGAPAGALYSPISLVHDPMESLFLANFGDDYDYHGLELQIFDHSEKGRGAALLMWHRDGPVDFYMTPGVRLQRERVEVGGGVGEWRTQDFPYRLAFTEHGVEAHVEIVLHDGRNVFLHVREHKRRAGKGLTMLAPAGESIERPRFLPVFRLHQIDLVRRAGTEVVFTLGGEERKPLRLPIPMPYSGRRVYFMRACPDPLIGLVNPAHDGPLAAMYPEAAGEFEQGGMVYLLAERGGHLEIARAVVRTPRHELWMELSPPLPDMAALRDGAAIAGRFGIGVDADAGIVRGVYQVRRQGDRVHAEMAPTEKWKPRGSLLARLTFRFFPPVFRTWPRTYHWQAEIDLAGEEGAWMTSGWTRTGRRA